MDKIPICVVIFYFHLTVCHEHFFSFFLSFGWVGSLLLEVVSLVATIRSYSLVLVLELPTVMASLVEHEL